MGKGYKLELAYPLDNGLMHTILATVITNRIFSETYYDITYLKCP